MGKHKAEVIIAIIAVLLVVGAGLGIYFAVRGSGSGGNEEADATSPKTVETDATVTSVPTVRVETDANVTSVPIGKRDRIAFLGNGDIYVVELDGTGEKRLTNRGDIWDFAVSPNGEWIAFVACPGDQNEIFKMRSDGTQESQVTAAGMTSDVIYPAFDPTSQYIYYFNMITPGHYYNEPEPPSRPDIPEGAVAIDIERYNIETTNVDRVYTWYAGEQCVGGLWADPKGGALYYNRTGTDFPSGEPHKITLGQQVTDSVYMPPEEREDCDIHYHLTGVSMDGTYVSYFKWTYQYLSGRPDEYVCYREASGYGEKVVVTEKEFQYKPPEYSGLEFSSVSDNTYYYSETVYPETINDITRTFFTGTTTTSSPKETGLILFIPQDPETGSSLTWHLLATE